MIALAAAEATLVTARLVLEPIVPAHASEMYAGLQDPSLYTYTDQWPPTSVEALRERYTRWARRRSPDGDEVWLNWLVRHRGTAAGFVQATVGEHEAAIGYVIFSTRQRNGIAREATAAMIEHLRTAGIRAFVATIDDANTASIRLATSLGFERSTPYARDPADGEEAEYRLRF